jgi:dihydroorotate dehydrogenase
MIKPVNYADSTFVTKTVTALPKKGNLKSFLPKPSKFFYWLAKGNLASALAPECIYIDMKNKILINSVGLTNRGIDFYTNPVGASDPSAPHWHMRNKPFVISFMPVSKASDSISVHEEHLLCCKKFVESLKMYLIKYTWRTDFAIQLNISCPNTGAKKSEDEFPSSLKKANELIDIISDLNAPIILKVDALYDKKLAYEVCKNPNCHALLCSNTIAFNNFELENFRERYFGSFDARTPLLLDKYHKTGGGGVSGAPMIEFTFRAHEEMMSMPDFPVPRFAGLGISSMEDVSNLTALGVSGIDISGLQIYDHRAASRLYSESCSYFNNVFGK